jgi:hypothetical protein
MRELWAIVFKRHPARVQAKRLNNKCKVSLAGGNPLGSDYRKLINEGCVCPAAIHRMD